MRGSKYNDSTDDQPDIKIALVGNPNSGKTTLFNLFTGASQRTGNWPGVTVERKDGHFKQHGRTVHVVDLPGTYSIGVGKTSTDERIARDYVVANPDRLFVNIVDINTLERGLFLTVQLREMGVPMLLVLNMLDMAEKRGMQVDIAKLQAEFKVPVVAVSLRAGKDIEELYQRIIHQAAQPEFVIDYGSAIENILKKIADEQQLTRQQALEALNNQRPAVSAYVQQLEQQTGENIAYLLAATHFETATDIASNVISTHGKASKTTSDKIDRWILGRFSGILLFLGIMYLLFLFSINFGGAFIDFFDQGVGAVLVDGLSQLLANVGSPAWLTVLLADGLGGGVQVVATFIPIIGALYLFLTILEESGYMARAAFVMDRLMRKIGISGKAFVPLIIGFGCNVPGIMATRTLDKEQERITAVMMSPFMSCGARLAVYALFAAAFFPHGGQNIVFILYLTGIFFAVLTGLIMKKTLLKGQMSDFLIELPVYQLPSMRNVLLNTWNKLKGFILGAGKVIVTVVIVINVLNSLGTDGSFGNQDSKDSALSVVAQSITPLFKPIGISEDNWPAVVGIVTGLLAKEVVVGTLDALYSNIGNASHAEQVENFSLWAKLKGALATIPVKLMEAGQNITDPLGLNVISDVQSLKVDNKTFGEMRTRFDGTIGAFAYLLFILLYFPCVAATGAMYREVGSWWTVLSVSWSTALGFGVAVIFYQGATILVHPLQSVAWIMAVLTFLAGAIYWFSHEVR